MNAHLQPQSRDRPRRPGFTIIELAVTMILLGMLMSLVVPLLGLIHKQRRACEQRVVAVQLIDNLMERFTAEDYESITQSAADQLAVPPEDASFFPGAKLTVTVSEIGEDIRGKQITIDLSWHDSDGAAVAPARLTSFVYPTGSPS